MNIEKYKKQRRLILALRLEWKRREDDLLHGADWSFNDPKSIEFRENKAEGIGECIAGLNRLLEELEK
jgi:hypothetical protein